eukprot:gene10624-14266_t
MLKYSRPARKFKSFIAELLPDEFNSSINSVLLFQRRVIRDHEYMKLFFYQNNYKKIMLVAISRVLIIFTIGIIVIESVRVLYKQKCDEQFSILSCQSISVWSVSVCQWKSKNKTCSFLNHVSPLSVIYIALLVGIIKSPFDRLIISFINHASYLNNVHTDPIDNKYPRQDSITTATVDDLEGDMGDELTFAQDRRSTLIRGVTHYLMKQNIDFVDPSQELLLLLKRPAVKYTFVGKVSSFYEWEKLSNIQTNASMFNVVNSFRCWYRLKQLDWYDISDPYNTADLMVLAYKSNHDVLIRKLRRSRTRASEISHFINQIPMINHADNNNNHMNRLDIEEKQDTLLLQLFVAESLVSFKRLIARIWIISIVFPSYAREEYGALHKALITRMRTILARKFLIMRCVNSLIQHFHPVCRVARTLPHLASSRLLMTLSDFDLPIAHLIKINPNNLYFRYYFISYDRYSPLVWDFTATTCANMAIFAYTVLDSLLYFFDNAMATLLLAFLNTAEWFQFALIESTSAAILNLLVIGLIILAKKSFIFFFVSIALGLIIIFLLIFYFMSLRRDSSNKRSFSIRAMLNPEQFYITKLLRSKRVFAKRKSKAKPIIIIKSSSNHSIIMNENIEDENTNENNINNIYETTIKEITEPVMTVYNIERVPSNILSTNNTKITHKSDHNKSVNSFENSIRSAPFTNNINSTNISLASSEKDRIRQQAWQVSSKKYNQIVPDKNITFQSHSNDY